jgi:sec-independent protein translocase protein TatC
MATSDIDHRTPPSWASEPEADDQNEGDGLDTMSLMDHLEELRWRIFKSLIAVTIAAVIAFIFRVQIFTFLEAPLPIEANAITAKTGGPKLIVDSLTGGFTAYLIVSLVVGCVFALPVILYQAWAFIAPGLYKHEKKNAVPFIIIGLFLFAAGLSLGYVVLQYPVQWLVSFSSASFTELVAADSYFKFVSIFLLVFGLIFELPLVLTFLAKVGIVSGETLRKKRAVAHVGMWIAGCFATPGADLYSPIFLGVAMSFLYELTIIFIRIFIKKNEEEV